MEEAEGGGDDLVPEIALAAALVALEEVENDEDDDDMLSDAEPDEELLRVKHKRRHRKKRDVKSCAWAQLLVDEDLKDDTSITAKQFRGDFRLPYPFFLRLVEMVKRKEWFATAQHDACGRQCHPVEHKVRFVC